MKAAHDYLWPTRLWHPWIERCFREHCEGWNYITYAGGASTSKSFNAAAVAVLFWLANPQQRGVVIASTTLSSLESRIWGYAMSFLSKMAIKLPFQYLGGNSPRILFPGKKEEGQLRDTLHGMFAVAAKSGSDTTTISSWIGRHPDDALLVILDESTDMPAALTKSFVNLDSANKPFQCIAIGNSNSIDDLHGAMSTPKAGWGSIDPMRMNKWETTMKNGVCLFFSCYESPAIFEQDPDRKKALSKFLTTEENIQAKKIELGEDNDEFWRFVLGFWRHSGTDNIVVSKQFIEKFGSNRRTEWGGIHDLQVVAGLDPAFSTGGDKCVLRLALLGVDISGLWVLDYRFEELLFEIPILRSDPDSADIQIAKRVGDILNAHNCPLHQCAIDATGQGRALGGVLQLHMKSMRSPIRIYSVKSGINPVNSFDTVIKSTYDLWFDMRNFIHHEQIRGLDHKTIMQLSSRQEIRTKGGKRALESKADFKRRIGTKFPSMAHSPDNADSAALALQSAIINFGFGLGKRRDIARPAGFQDMQKMLYDVERQERRQNTNPMPPPRATFLGELRGGYKRPF